MSLSLSLHLRNLTLEEASILQEAQKHAQRGQWACFPIRGSLKDKLPSDVLPPKLQHLVEIGLIKVHPDRPLDIIEDDLLEYLWKLYTADLDEEDVEVPTQEDWAEFCWCFYQERGYWPPTFWDSDWLCFQRSFYFCPAGVEPFMDP